VCVCDCVRVGVSIGVRKSVRGCGCGCECVIEHMAVSVCTQTKGTDCTTAMLHCATVYRESCSNPSALPISARAPLFESPGRVRGKADIREECAVKERGW
jgi:hypothetical protein